MAMTADARHQIYQRKVWGRKQDQGPMDGCARGAHPRSGDTMPHEHTGNFDDAAKHTVRPHQPGQTAFRVIPPEDIEWKPFPAFPPSVRLAVLVGQPSEDGPYTIRVKVPRRVKLMPHKHPRDRIYTV